MKEIDIILLADDFKSTSHSCGVTVDEFDVIGFANALEGKFRMETVAPQNEIEWLRAWLNSKERFGLEATFEIMKKRMRKLMIGKGDEQPLPEVQSEDRGEAL